MREYTDTEILDFVTERVDAQKLVMVLTPDDMVLQPPAGLRRRDISQGVSVRDSISKLMRQSDERPREWRAAIESMAKRRRRD